MLLSWRPLEPHRPSPLRPSRGRIGSGDSAINAHVWRVTAAPWKPIEGRTDATVMIFRDKSNGRQMQSFVDNRWNDNRRRNSSGEIDSSGVRWLIIDTGINDWYLTENNECNRQKEIGLMATVHQISWWDPSIHRVKWVGGGGGGGGGKER